MEITAKPIDLTINYEAPKIVIGQPESAVKPAQSEVTPYSKEKPVDRDTLEQVTKELDKFMQSLNAGIQFSVHEKTNRLIVQVVDKRDGTVLKEFPPHELLDTLANIQEYVGILLDKKA